MAGSDDLTQLWTMVIALVITRVVESAFPDVSYSVTTTAFVVFVVWVCYVRKWSTTLFGWRGTEDAGFNARLAHTFQFITILLLLFFGTLFIYLIVREWNGVIMSTHILLVYFIVPAAVIVAVTCDVLDATKTFTPPS